MIRKTFLAEFCQHLLSKYGKEGLKNVTVVIPSQRVALYIREELVKLIDGSFWMPRILPMNLFIEELHELVVIDELEVVFELYEAYCEVFETPDSFDEFLSWSSMILADFNDIDKYLLDAGQVFSNLQSIKDIESWSFNLEELSSTQKSFLKFWEQLGDLYKTFHSRLSLKGEATNARVYRLIAEEPEKYLTSIKNDTFFIGFNALSVAEEKLMRFLVRSGAGEVVWDIDSYYLNSSVMEAGRFVRKHKTWTGIPDYVSIDHLSRISKKINIYPANSNLQQVAIASKLIGEMGNEGLDQTALVFADESLLKPMLNVLPRQVEQLNVAMGYPLSAASVFSFFEEAIQVQVNINRYKNKGSIYFKDFIQITQHEVFQSFLMEYGFDLSKILKKITNQNYVYLPVNMVREEFSGDYSKVEFLLVQAHSIEQFLEQIIEFFKEIYRLSSKNVVERESIAALISALEKLMSVQSKYNHVRQIATFGKLAKQLLAGLSVSFLGEPLEGLQLLGLLETRALDFRHVILTSCNEDVLPKRNFSNSLMPHDLRIYFGLPTKDDKEAIFAYYFYRLIQRAEKVDLIYNGGESDGLQANEISRYLLQLKEELGSEDVVINEVAVESVSITKKREVSIGNSDVLQNRLMQWFEKGISASGINQFNTCPKNFVYTQLMGLSQNEDVEEDIELSTYGTIVHEVLENLYKDAGKLVGVKELEGMLGSYKEELVKSFDARFPGGNYQSGKNLLLFETAVHTLKKYLRAELDLVREFGVITILGLEEKREKVIEVSSSKGRVKLKIKGLVDRIDKIGDQVRVIDYKTGRVDKLDFKGDWSKITNYQLQLMTYLYLFDTEEDVACGMVSFKQLNQGFQLFEFAGVSSFDKKWLKENFEPEFEAYLADFVERAMNSNFEHDPKSQYCLLC